MTKQTVINLKEDAEKRLKLIHLAFEADTTGNIYNNPKRIAEREYVLGELHAYSLIIDMWER